MKVDASLTIALSDIFKDVHIDGSTPMPVDFCVPVNLYGLIKVYLIEYIQTFGVYEMFFTELDSIIDADVKYADNDEFLDGFLVYAKERLILDIKQDNLKILDFQVSSHDTFDIVIDIDFPQMWNDFKEDTKNG